MNCPSHAPRNPGPRRGLAALAGLATLLLAAGCRTPEPPPPPPPVVEVSPVLVQDVPVRSEWVGTTNGLVNATIRAQVTGYVVRQAYRDGDLVRKGALLFELDARPFSAALEQAAAGLEQARATAHQAEAAEQQARAEVARNEALHVDAAANLRRTRALVQEGIVTQKDLDDAVSVEQSAQASVVAAQAAVTASQASAVAARDAVSGARAAVERARVDLGFTKVVSPIDGVAGLATANVGDLVGPGQAGELTTVSTIDPIKVYYPLSEQDYTASMTPFPTMAEGLRHQKAMELELVLADGSVYAHHGRVDAIDRQVDVRTGTLRVEAVFPNPEKLLRPGQFVRVRAVTGVKKGALLVPQRAVAELQGSYQVAVVGAGDRVEVRTVKPAERLGALWVIDAGLAPGDRVVVEGVQKAKQGIRVTPRAFAAASGGR